jgi:uncharacterized protein YjbI with pentapeptide repeats
MKNYINYRYRSLQNQSFISEFKAGNENYADFVGAKIKSCNFRGTSLVGADFSETEIGRDEQKFKTQTMEMAWHLVIGIPLGFAAWFFNRAVIGCGVGLSSDPYGWLTNPFVWIAALSVAATLSHGWLFIAYMGMIGLMMAIAMVNMVAANAIGVVLMLMTLAASIFGLYLGYQKGSIAVGMIWIAVAVSSAISSGYSWLKYQEIHYAVLFAAIAVLPAILATRAFNLHFNKVKMSSMTCFQGADLTNARFVNAVLENCDFSGANLDGINWYGATMRNCRFPRGWSMDNQQAIAQNPEDSEDDVEDEEIVEKLIVNEAGDLSNVGNT